MMYSFNIILFVMQKAVRSNKYFLYSLYYVVAYLKLYRQSGLDDIMNIYSIFNIILSN